MEKILAFSNLATFLVSGVFYWLWRREITKRKRAEENLNTLSGTVTGLQEDAKKADTARELLYAEIKKREDNPCPTPGCARNRLRSMFEAKDNKGTSPKLPSASSGK